MIVIQNADFPGILANKQSLLSLQYPYELALVAAVVWCLLVSFSRIYLGMHSVLVSYLLYSYLVL